MISRSARERLAQLRPPLLAEVGPPLRLHLGHDGHRQCHGLRAPLRDPHEAGTPVARIRDPLDEALPLELVDEEAGGLLGDTGALGELGGPAALGRDPLEDARLRGRDLVAAAASAANTRSSIAR